MEAIKEFNGIERCMIYCNFKNMLKESIDACVIDKLSWYSDCKFDDYFGFIPEIWDEDECLGQGFDFISFKVVVCDETKDELEELFEEARESAWEDACESYANEISDIDEDFDEVTDKNEDEFEEIGSDSQVYSDTEFSNSGFRELFFDDTFQSHNPSVSKFFAWIGATAIKRQNETKTDFCGNVIEEGGFTTYYKRK